MLTSAPRPPCRRPPPSPPSRRRVVAARHQPRRAAARAGPVGAVLDHHQRGGHRRLLGRGRPARLRGGAADRGGGARQGRLGGPVDPLRDLAGAAHAPPRLERRDDGARPGAVHDPAAAQRERAAAGVDPAVVHPGRVRLRHADRRGRPAAVRPGRRRRPQRRAAADRLPLGGRLRLDGLLVLHGRADRAPRTGGDGRVRRGRRHSRWGSTACSPGCSSR